MDRIVAGHLRDLSQDRSPVCVSLYMPTRVTAPDHHQNPVALKNLLRQAEKQLAGMGDRSGELLRPARKLVDDESFWRGRTAGLAIFASASQFRVFRVPVAVPVLVEVHDHFVLRPLYPLLTPDSRCWLLVISRNRARLFEATPYEIRDMTPESMPAGLHADLSNEQVDRGSQVHSSMRGSHGKQGAVFHGQGGRPDTVKDETARFFGLVDACLGQLGDDRHLPLILAGVESDVAQFRSLTHYSQVADEQVCGNMDHLSDHEVHERAETAIAAVAARRQAHAISRLGGLNGARVSRSIRDILPAVCQGRVESLFICGSERRWGRYAAESGLVQVHATRQPGDEDLLETAALEAVRHGGTVFTVTAEELPGDSPVAAIYRY